MSTLKVNTITDIAGNSITGQILQYKYVNRTASQFSTSSYVDTQVPGLTNTITLGNSSNKVVIQVNLTPYFNGTTTDGQYALKIYRDTTIIFSEEYLFFRDDGHIKAMRPHTTYLDSPGDTNSHTYKIRVANKGGTATLYFMNSTNNSGNMVLMEVAA